MVDWETWEYHYSVLRQAERNRPIEVLKEICNRETLFTQRANLLQIFRAADQSPAWDHADAEFRGAMFYFHETTLLLWEAVYRAVELVEMGGIRVEYITE